MTGQDRTGQDRNYDISIRVKVSLIFCGTNKKEDSLSSQCYVMSSTFVSILLLVSSLLGAWNPSILLVVAVVVVAVVLGEGEESGRCE